MRFWWKQKIRSNKQQISIYSYPRLGFKITFVG
jgi:hypothetical protein